MTPGPNPGSNPAASAQGVTATIISMTSNPDQTPSLLGAAEPGSLHALIIAQLEDDQAQDLVTIPLEGKSSIADHMIIASGRSEERRVGEEC